jgi:hypothetical protein
MFENSTATSIAMPDGYEKTGVLATTRFALDGQQMAAVPTSILHSNLCIAGERQCLSMA